MHRSRRRASYARLNSPRFRALRKLREAGFVEEEAQALAHAFTLPESQCQICGVPQKFLATLTRLKQPPPFGAAHYWTRLQIDHVEWNPPKVRPLCYKCNLQRGRGRYTDDQVWLKAFEFWTWLLPTKQLKWLQKAPPSERK